MKKTVRALGALGATAGGMLLMAGPASAHISPTPAEVPADGFTAVTLTVPHGCDESPTRQLTIEVPEQLNSVTPEVHAGWDIDVETEELAEPIDDGEGGQITERMSQIVYTARSGNELPAHFRDSFTLGFRAPDAEGVPLFFKTVQTCVEGETPWIEEYTGEGEEPEYPSPVVRIGPAGAAGHGGEDEATDEDMADDGTADDGTEVDAEEAAATQAADDDDGDSATGLAVAGLIAGLLGLGTGGLALVRSRKPATS